MAKITYKMKHYYIFLFIFNAAVELANTGKPESKNFINKLRQKVELATSSSRQIIRNVPYFYPSLVHLRSSNQASDYLNLKMQNSLQSEKIDSKSKPDLKYILNCFKHGLSTPRTVTVNSSLNEKAKQFIENEFRGHGLQVFRQPFTINNHGKIIKGENIISYYPSIKRIRKKALGEKVQEDKILILGAHYDTVKTVGTDDNASGVVATLELARMLSTNKVRLPFTIIFVNFDLEEKGLLGSTKFVSDYLIPFEISQKKSKYLGGFIFDMLLNYDPKKNVQVLPRDIKESMPELVKKIKRNRNSGNFISAWYRRNTDNYLFNALNSFWENSNLKNNYKLIGFDPPLPATDYISEIYGSNYGTFTRSDHASFWYPRYEFGNHFKFISNLTFPAILLTDMGPFRSKGQICYHLPCDNANWLTHYNLNFFMHTIEMIYKTIVNGPFVNDEISAPTTEFQLNTYNNDHNGVIPVRINNNRDVLAN